MTMKPPLDPYDPNNQAAFDTMSPDELMAWHRAWLAWTGEFDPHAWLENNNRPGCWPAIFDYPDGRQCIVNALKPEEPLPLPDHPEELSEIEATLRRLGWTFAIS